MESVQDNNVNNDTKIIRLINLLNGVFLLGLILSSGFISEIVNCKYQKLLFKNIYFKHFIAFLILYILNTNLFKDDIHPMSKIYNSLVLYIVFLVFMRQNRVFTIVIFILIFILHLMYEHHKYNKKKNLNINNLDKNIEILSIFIIVLAVIGFFINYFERKKEYKREFNIIKFLLGNTICSK